jgi:hypothetical protein
LVGAVEINGLSTLSFDDTSSYLSLTVPIDPTGSTGFAVASYPNLLGTGPILGQFGAGVFWGPYNTLPEYFLVAGGGLGVPFAGSTAPALYGYTSQSEGSDPQTLFFNGSVLDPGVEGNTAIGSASFDTVGHRLPTEWLNGNLGLVLVYDRVLSSDELAANNAGLLSRWAIVP